MRTVPTGAATGLWRALTLLAAVAVLGGCEQPASAPLPPPATTHDLPTASTARSCEPGEDRCDGMRTLERCSPDGLRWQRSRCSAQELCLTDICAPLSLPAEPAGGPGAEQVEPPAIDAMLRPHGAGWMNAWASIGSMFDKAAAELTASRWQPYDGSRAKQFEPLCRPEGFVDVHRRRYGKRRERRHHVLAAYAIAGRARRATLKVGAQGQLRIWLNGALVSQLDRPSAQRPLRDEQLIAVELRAGINTIVVDVAQAGHAPTGLWMRLHGSDNRVPRDLRWALPHGLRCNLGKLVRRRMESHPVAGGFELRQELKLLGLAPEAVSSLAWKLRVGGRRDRVELLAGEASLTSLAAGLRNSVTASFTKATKAGVSTTLAEAELDAAPIHYRHALHERIVALARLAATLPPSIAVDSRDSYLQATDTLMDALASGHSDLRWMRARTATLEKLAAELKAGRDPYPTKTGIVYRAYRSKLDGRLQPYVAYVPPRHDPEGKPMPLIVIFHGLGQKPALALRTAIGAGPDEEEDRAWATRHLPPFPDYGAILVAPWGYDNAGQRQLGEHDVLRVIERMKAHYNVDAERVTITGYSLGGTVAFALPLHYPSLFAAAAPLCGYPNLLSWKSVRDTPKQPFEEKLLAKRYLRNYADNGLHIPLNIVHGGRDGPHRSAVMADRYEQLGYRRVFDLQDDLAHNVWDYAYKGGRMVAWLRRYRRPTTPDHVRLRTGEYRYDRAHWLRLLEMLQPEELAAIDARLDRKASTLEIATDNVAALTVDLAALGLRPDTAVIDGTTIQVPDEGSSLVLVKKAGQFAVTSAAPALRGRKRHGVSGPLDDVLRHPILIIYGTLDPLQTDTNRLVAEHYASNDTWAGARFPMRADHAVRDAELRGRSLVLIGNPTSNRVTAQLVASLPVSFDSDGVTLRGLRYSGPDVGVSLIHPNPRDSDHYVVLHAGVGYAGTLSSRHLPRLAPDFLVYDRGIAAARGGELLGLRRVLAGGFFTSAWQ